MFAAKAVAPGAAEAKAPKECHALLSNGYKYLDVRTSGERERERKRERERGRESARERKSARARERETARERERERKRE